MAAQPFGLYSIPSTCGTNSHGLRTKPWREMANLNVSAAGHFHNTVPMGLFRIYKIAIIVKSFPRPAVGFHCKRASWLPYLPIPTPSLPVNLTVLDRPKVDLSDIVSEPWMYAGYFVQAGIHGKKLFIYPLGLDSNILA